LEKSALRYGYTKETFFLVKRNYLLKLRKSEEETNAKPKKRKTQKNDEG
jgi:hypothetical protein